MGRRIYLDVAASAPVYRSAKKAFLRALPLYGNPSAFHEEGREAKTLLEKSRETIARILVTKPEFITFTSGATEANVLAITGVVKSKENPHVLYQAGAHSSVVETIKALGVQSDEVPLKDGDLDLKILKEKLKENTVLVCIEAVSSETGMKVSAREVKEMLKGTKALLHVDATQLPFSESPERSRLAADLITLDAQKIGGVRGVGLLMHAVPISPLLFGGGQERGVRSGTENVALIASFAQALVECEKRREGFVTRAIKDREYLIDELTKIPNTYVNEGKKNAPHILNLSFEGRDTDYLTALLSEKGYAVSTKSACETDSSEGSRAVYALTFSKERAESTLRISWGPETSSHDIRSFVRVCREAVRFLDEKSPK